MNTTLLATIAAEVGCEVAVLRAVAAVESAGSGFLPDGRPRILFEAHVFSQQTGRRFDASHPELSTRQWRRDLYRGGAAEWDRLERARLLDADAALAATSWGMFQLMGFNHRRCGYGSVAEMASAMRGDAAQVRAFGRFLASDSGLVAALRQKDWSRFARLYNGPGQVAIYAARLADAYAGLTDGAASRPVPIPGRSMPHKSLRQSKTLLVGGTGFLAGLGALAEQLESALSVVGTTRAAIESATGIGSALAALATGPALGWLLTMLALGGLGFVLWRYARKVRHGDAVVR